MIDYNNFIFILKNNLALKAAGHSVMVCHRTVTARVFYFHTERKQP